MIVGIKQATDTQGNPLVVDPTAVSDKPDVEAIVRAVTTAMAGEHGLARRYWRQDIVETVQIEPGGVLRPTVWPIESVTEVISDAGDNVPVAIAGTRHRRLDINGWSSVFVWGTALHVTYVGGWLLPDALPRRSHDRCDRDSQGVARWRPRCTSRCHARRAWRRYDSIRPHWCVSLPALGADAHDGVPVVPAPTRRFRASARRLARRHGRDVVITRSYRLFEPVSGDAVTDLEVAAAAAVGDLVIELRRAGSASLRGRVVAGAALTAGGATYTVAADASVEGNHISMTLRTALTAAVAEGEAVTLSTTVELHYRAIDRELKTAEAQAGMTLEERTLTLVGDVAPRTGDIIEGRSVTQVLPKPGSWLVRLGAA